MKIVSIVALACFVLYNVYEVHKKLFNEQWLTDIQAKQGQDDKPVNNAADYAHLGNTPDNGPAITSIHAALQFMKLNLFFFKQKPLTCLMHFYNLNMLFSLIKMFKQK